MEILQGFGEVFEVSDTIETMENNELLGQKDALQEKLDAAIKTSNTEKANFFKGELTRINEQLARNTKNQTGETSFGSGHSSKYWYDKAAQELAKHGKSPLYKSYLNNAGASKVEEQQRR